MVYKWLEALCPLCRCPVGDTAGLCAVCRADLPWLGHACRRCALPLPIAAGALCGPCLRRPSPVDRSLCALRYQAPVGGLVSAFKFHRDLAAGAALADLLAQTVLDQTGISQTVFRQTPMTHADTDTGTDTRAFSLPDAIVPVPLHPRRLRQRGYNQAAELAKPLARLLARPLLSHAVERCLDTADQIGLSALQRRRNLRKAFAVRAPLPAHVAIVDDVLTTGATVLTLAKCLRAAGVSEITVWCLARTV
ncbi:ComF family protein [Permianibacter sp. IMCC34836]|uniref:ComF family protein n=1 Tax=Permianibacter fluminis TaxID=2738515 RepID=UPI001557B096|nr:ComF family protein [Permianibacter fluminis]NQD35399.1 ComF family protein [Permianibacter fluminis]